MSRSHSGLRECPTASRVDLLEQPRFARRRSDDLRCTATRSPRCSTRLNMPQVLHARATVAGAGGGGGPAAVRQVLAAQPRARAARRAARRRAPAPAARVSASRATTVRAAAHRGERLHRRRAARHTSGWCARRAGRPSPPSCRSCCRRGEHLEADVDADGARRTPGRAVSGARRAGASPAPTRRRMPASWRQTVEDVCHRSSVGTGRGQRLLRWSREPVAVDVAAGESAPLSATVGTDARAEPVRRRRT